MTNDWAMLEALEEVDRIGWAAPPVAPPRRDPRRDPRNTGLAMMQDNALISACLKNAHAAWQAGDSVAAAFWTRRAQWPRGR